MKDNGKKINKMVMERKFGQMEQFMKENTFKEKKKGEDYLNGQMDLFMMDNFIKIIFKDLENIDGKMEEDILENGLIIKWMGKEYIIYIYIYNRYSIGKMVENMKDYIKMIKKKVLGNFNGLMEE